MSMASGIGCFKGCGNPVIGQCQGFNGSCGAFYCASHSREKLCEDCNFKKDEEKYIQDTIQEYTVLSQERNRTEFGCCLFIVFAPMLGVPIGLGVAALYKLVTNVESGEEAPIGIIAGLLVAFLLYLRRNHVIDQRNKELEKISLEKPGFSEFYKEWRKEQQISNISTAWNIVSATAAVAHSLEKDATNREVKKAAIEIQKNSKR